jgi:DMSO/TMAO reductase YedYZ molybdopterin-dependent catalytic subunit
MPRGQRLWFGALIGLILTLPLTALFYAGYRRAGLPFLPFILFDWGTRHLPGPILAFGIGSMVRAIRWLNLGDTATTAKLAEQTMAVLGFLVAGMFVGAVFFGIALRRMTSMAGLAVGGLLGIGAVLVSRGTGITPGANPAIGALWILLALMAWGAVLGWACRHTVRNAGDEYPPLGAAGRSDRRQFVMRLGSAAAAVSLVGAALGRVAGGRGEANRGEANRLPEGPWSESHALPNADAAVKPPPGTRAEFTPLAQHYRIDINTTPPEVPESSWRLRWKGLVQQPLVWTLDDLRGRPAMHQFITLSCISNLVGGDLIGTTRWTGVSLKQLLPELGLLPGATHLKIRSADGFHEVVALDTIRADDRVMLTYAWDGLPLAAGHGFPLRIYIPDRYGMKQPKWIESIEAIDHWEPGFWVSRGWDREARMKATSAIDAIATDMMIGQPGADRRVPIGGFAHAGVRGISKVQIRADSGPWQDAQLRTPLSGQTWVMWRYDWPLQKGKHTFTVRCFEGDGTPQIEQEAPPEPNGASGLYTRSAMF